MPPRGHKGPGPAGGVCAQALSRKWLGRKGSNLRMLESKSSALPLGDAPTVRGGTPGADPYKASRPHPQTGFESRQNPPDSICCVPVAGAGGHGYKGASRREGVAPFALVRRVAQPGRALRSGRRGRRFESSLSDQFFPANTKLEVRQRPGRVFGAAEGRSSASEDENGPKACYRQSSLSDQFSPAGASIAFRQGSPGLGEARAHPSGRPVEGCSSCAPYSASGRADRRAAPTVRAFSGDAGVSGRWHP